VRGATIGSSGLPSGQAGVVVATCCSQTGKVGEQGEAAGSVCGATQQGLRTNMYACPVVGSTAVMLPAMFRAAVCR
jgi:hypothetical protein